MTDFMSALRMRCEGSGRFRYSVVCDVCDGHVVYQGERTWATNTAALRAAIAHAARTKHACEIVHAPKPRP